jgi:hypothetical protein
MAEILGKDPRWSEQQAGAFQTLSADYLPMP